MLNFGTQFCTVDHLQTIVTHESSLREQASKTTYFPRMHKLIALFQCDWALISQASKSQKSSMINVKMLYFGQVFVYISITVNPFVFSVGITSKGKNNCHFSKRETFTTLKPKWTWEQQINHLFSVFFFNSLEDITDIRPSSLASIPGLGAIEVHFLRICPAQSQVFGSCTTFQSHEVL